MLTYSFDHLGSEFLYEHLYACLKHDIQMGKLAPDEKLPSKRSFAAHLGVSVITVENAYGQLVDEGYLYSLPKRGYYVAKIAPEILHVPHKALKSFSEQRSGQGQNALEIFADFSSNQLPPENFPFTIWSRVLRETLLEKQVELMQSTPVSGAEELRRAIVGHLQSFRNMMVSPEQIVIGAGTEYLYSLVVRLLGSKQIFALEDPGYAQVSRIYTGCGATCRYLPLDADGMSIDALRQSDATVAHISPSHHFPTGIVMPIARRYALLAWATEDQQRYILEDDYDSEFRFVGRPIPTLFSIDAASKVIYLNTFSKTLTPTIRISYMVLPPELVEPFHEKLSFLACPVSNFEQYTLARFIEAGYFEKHLTRMRTQYRKKRDLLVRCIKQSALKARARIIEQSSGLHFLLQLQTEVSDAELKMRLFDAGIKVKFLSDYFHTPRRDAAHILLLNYSSIAQEKIPEAVQTLAEIITACPNEKRNFVKE